MKNQEPESTDQIISHGSCEQILKNEVDSDETKCESQVTEEAAPHEFQVKLGKREDTEKTNNSLKTCEESAIIKKRKTDAELKDACTVVMAMNKITSVVDELLQDSQKEVTDKNKGIEKIFESLQNQKETVIQNLHIATGNLFGNIYTVSEVLYESLHTVVTMTTKNLQANCIRGINNLRKEMGLHVEIVSKETQIDTISSSTDTGASSSTATQRNSPKRSTVGRGRPSTSTKAASFYSAIDGSILDCVMILDMRVDNRIISINTEISSLESNTHASLSDLSSDLKLEIRSFRLQMKEDCNNFKIKTIKDSPATQILFNEIMNLIDGTSDSLHEINDICTRKLGAEIEEVIKNFKSETEKVFGNIRKEKGVVVDGLRLVIKDIIENRKVREIPMSRIREERDIVLGNLQRAISEAFREFANEIETTVENITQETENSLKCFRTLILAAIQNMGEEIEDTLELLEKEAEATNESPLKTADR